MEKSITKQPEKQLKIVVYGPESTGKTTLAKQLATHFKASYVPEYARKYAEAKQEKGQKLTVKDVMPIAEGQLQLEAKVFENKMMICDTDLLSTLAYATIYYPEFDTEALQKKIEATHAADLYFLTYIDVPWEADGIRDLPQKRENAFSIFKKILKTHQKPYVLLKGNPNERLQTAIANIKTLKKLP